MAAILYLPQYIKYAHYLWSVNEAVPGNTVINFVIT